jgi:hypothetical protein
MERGGADGTMSVRRTEKVRKRSTDAVDYLDGILWLLEHEELRGYMPTVISVRDFEMPDGGVETCIRGTDVIDICLGFLQAHQDGAIRSEELLRMVPRTKVALKAYRELMRRAK